MDPNQEFAKKILKITRCKNPKEMKDILAELPQQGEKADELDMECVEKMELSLWVPREVYDFFSEVLEWEDYDYQATILGCMSGSLDIIGFDVPKAAKYQALLDNLIREVYEEESKQ